MQSAVSSVFGARGRVFADAADARRAWQGARGRVAPIDAADREVLFDDPVNGVGAFVARTTAGKQYPTMARDTPLSRVLLPLDPGAR